MQTRIFEGRVTALSSISHNGGDSFGIQSMLRREKFVQPDGTVADVPTISGNGMRGLLRDRGMLHMCRHLGYGVDDVDGAVRGLTLAAFHFLFSGGSLTSTGSKALDIESARKIQALIPLVGVFGGAVGNLILPGRLKCGKLIPICSETVHLLPERFQNANAPTIWDYLQKEMYTRKDDEKNEHLRQVISPATRGLLDSARAAKASKLANEPQEDTGQHQQMMYYVETFAAGTPFYWKVCLDDAADVEYEAFGVALKEFSRLPYIGGKSNIGMGEVAVDFDKWYTIDSRMSAPTTVVGLPLGSLYAQHLADRGCEIRELLGVM
jgi:CRISPR type IV-associated protein Csf2